jgi:endoglucanase
MRRILVQILALLGLLVAVPAAHAYYSGVPTPGNPLAGYPWYVDQTRGSWWVAIHNHPIEAAPLRLAANNPMGKSFGSWIDAPGVYVRDYIARSQAEQPGSIPFLNLARIEGISCPYPVNGGLYNEDRVKQWVDGFSRGIGDSRVMVIVETDKLVTIGCLPHWAQARRYRELSYEVHALHARNPNAIVYIDAGAENWGKTPRQMARRLVLADVAEAQGFALDASHHNWTWKEVGFGRGISRFLGNKHFVVNTSSNGWGPNPHGFSTFSQFYHFGCSPPGEGLGYFPTVKTPDRRLDAFLWLGVPGFDGGDCLGQNGGYTFYLQEALSLVLHANPSTLTQQLGKDNNGSPPGPDVRHTAAHPA